LTRLTSRVDNWLAEIQTGIQGIRSDIEAFQARAEATKSGLLLAYNLVSLVATLLYIWVIYSQIVVVRHHWKRRAAAAPVSVTPGPGEPAMERTDTGTAGSSPSEITDRKTTTPVSAEIDQTVATDQSATPIVDAAPDRIVIAEEDLPTAPEPPSPADTQSDKQQSTDV
jgi:hypothetical protein